MTLANILITPYYLEIAMGMPLLAAKDTVKTLLPTTIIPFNVVKSILNASLSMLLYKPLSKVLKSMGVSHSFNGKKTSLSNAQTSVSNKTRSLIVTIVSAAIVVIAFIIVFAVLGGKIA
jgi:riboflavin transporter FmnP